MVFLSHPPPVFEITFAYQDVCNCHQVKYSFRVEYNCKDLGNWYLSHWCHMITCSHVALAGNATRQIACGRDAQLQEFAFNKRQTKRSRCIEQLLNETIEVLYDTRICFPPLRMRVFTLAALPQTRYSSYSPKVNFHDAEESLFFLLERTPTSSLTSCSSISHVISPSPL